MIVLYNFVIFFSVPCHVVAASEDVWCVAMEKVADVTIEADQRVWKDVTLEHALLGKQGHGAG